MIIYVDVYFLKNIMFNFLLIYLTSILIRKVPSLCRIFLASIIGGGYAVFALFYPSVFNSLLLKIIVGISMLSISFGKKQLSMILSSFFTLAYLIAGIIASIVDINNQVIMIIFASSIVLMFYIYEKNKKKNHFYEIEIQIYNNEIALKAKLDTGNELKDSLFGTPVIIVSEEKIKKKIDSELIKILNNEKLEIPHIYKNKIKLISFKTISGEGIKIGIKVDVHIVYENNMYLKRKAIMILSERNFKNYDVLIGEDLLQGGLEYENNDFDKIKNKRTI